MRNILVVDDEAAIRQLIHSFLKTEGFVIWEAGDGKMASQILEQSVPDLLITDLILPEKEGIELIQLVRTLHPKMPIIAMSGAAPINLKMAHSLGANEILLKPFTSHELLNSVKKALGGVRPWENSTLPFCV
jgi:DNA-binding response OmpR family regulator